MNSSKDYLKNNDISPRISFKQQAKHQLKLISDKEDQIKDDKGEILKGVKYMVEEDGEKKSFFTSSVGLISRLAEIEPGTEVVIEMKSKKANDGTWKSYFVVSKVGEEAKEEDLDF